MLLAKREFDVALGLLQRRSACDLSWYWAMSSVGQRDGVGWTEQRRSLHALLAERMQLLADYYESALYFLHTPDAPARMSHLAHAVRELCNHMPDAVNVARMDRSNTESKLPILTKAWEKAGLPDDVGEVPGCSTSGSATDECHIPRPVLVAAADLVLSTRIRGSNRRRAALMIVDPHAPDGQSTAERHSTVDRWVKIVDRLFPWVHAFDKRPQAIPEDQLADDFNFLEDVMRGVLAPLDVVADLDDLLAQTQQRVLDTDGPGGSAAVPHVSVDVEAPAERAGDDA